LSQKELLVSTKDLLVHVASGLDQSEKIIAEDVSFATKGAARVDEGFVSECGEWIRSA